MAKTDDKTRARKQRMRVLTSELGELYDDAIQVTGCESVHSFHAKIGSKYEQFVSVKERSIPTHEEFVSLYIDALIKHVLSIDPAVRRGSAYYELASWYQTSVDFRAYMEKFLERSFLKHYDAYTRVKPKPQDTVFWIGQNHADYGLFITPRFRGGEWQNDKSEIRKFKPDYFTIGHVLRSGLVLPDKAEYFDFDTPDDYLDFFKNVLVRNAGSEHQDEVAERYCQFVLDAQEPESVPLLIPELRYRGRDRAHKYRLDFCVIDPFSMQKVGFELSPWSSHGQLKGTKKKLVKVVNAEARANYEREVKKCEAYFVNRGIHVTVFTDSDLADPDAVFETIKRYLRPERKPQQLLLRSRQQLLEMDLDSEVPEDEDND